MKPSLSAMQRQQLDCWRDFLGPITENVLISAKLKYISRAKCLYYKVCK